MAKLGGSAYSGLSSETIVLSLFTALLVDILKRLGLSERFRGGQDFVPEPAYLSLRVV